MPRNTALPRDGSDSYCAASLHPRLDRQLLGNSWGEIGSSGGSRSSSSSYSSSSSSSRRPPLLGTTVLVKIHCRQVGEGRGGGSSVRCTVHSLL